MSVGSILHAGVVAAQAPVGFGAPPSWELIFETLELAIVKAGTRSLTLGSPPDEFVGESTGPAIDPQQAPAHESSIQTSTLDGFGADSDGTPVDLIGAGAETPTISGFYSSGASFIGDNDDATEPSNASVQDDASRPVNFGATTALKIANEATTELENPSAQSVVFSGTTGTLKLDDAAAFTGQVSGLSGSDALDLADIKFGAATTATYLGTATGGTLTVTDGSETANISLVGNYLSSTWDVSSDGNGGTVVVDPVVNSNWQELDVGAGGYLTGMDIAPDDTKVVRTDTYGAYIWNGSQWQQLVTSASMPAAWVAANSSTAADGVNEIQIAASNSNILYMEYDGYVFKSTNKGTTWTETSFAPVVENTTDAYRYDGQKMAIDPDNPNVVYAGTPQNGMFVTTDGGTTWQSVSGVPVGLSDGNGNYPGITGIEFDPALGVSGGKTNTVFAASYGHGVYESTNGGASWSSIGGPSTVAYAAVSSTGVYYVVGNSTTGSVPNSLWSYKNGVWTELLLDTSGNGIGTVAVDPFNPNEIVTQTSGGNLDVSYDGGLTWSGTNWYNHFSSTDVPWLANSGNYMSVGATLFDQVTPNELWTSDGVGVWNTTVPTSGFQWYTPVTWNDQSAGIEQLVANDILVAPGGDPIVASWDRAFFTITNPNAYPTSYGPVNDNFAAGWSLDYASSNPNFIVGLADWWGNEESGYSTNDGQTWTPFPTELQNVMGGTIAASTPENIIWAPANRTNPYYTLDGGQTWNPITLPGVTNWNNFDWAYYLDVETVTADRVLPNTFYLYYGLIGVFESTNGGVSWTQVHGPLSAGDTDNYEIRSVPGQAGDLFFTAGPQGGSQPNTLGFYHSTNQGVTWTAVANVTAVSCFGFGAPAPGQSYPAIYIVGAVNGVSGIWQSNNEGQSWVQIGTSPENSLDYIKTISGDPNIYGQVYVGFGGSGYAYLSGAPAGPTVTAVAASPSTGIELPGNTVTLTLTMSEAVTVTGTPTLTLNDGGTATYSGGSGTNALAFSHTVGQSDSDVSALAVTQVNEPNGATITDSSGNAATLSLSGLTQSGPQIDPPILPTISSLVESPASADLNAGKTVTLTVNLNEAVTVAGGTPTLTLNDGGTATYVSGSGSSALVFSYTVGAGQNTSGLSATGVNLNSATITDGSGNAANLSLSGLTQSGPQIDTTAPTVSSMVASGTGITGGSGDLNAGKTVTLTLNLSEAVTVAGGTPTLTLNDGGTATYSGGSGSNALTFTYTVGAGQNTSDLTATAVNLNSATVTDAAGNAANLTGAVTSPSGTLQIDTTTPTVSSVVASGTGITSGAGDLNAGKTATLTVNLSEAVTVAGGTPTLTLNDGATATYSGGSGSSALTFTYTVAAGQNTSDLTVTAVNLNSATVADSVGNAANLTGAVTNPSGTLQIDTTTPTVPSAVASGAASDVGRRMHHISPDHADFSRTVDNSQSSHHATIASGSAAWSPMNGDLANGEHNIPTTEANVTDVARSHSTSMATFLSLLNNDPSGHDSSSAATTLLFSGGSRCAELKVVSDISHAANGHHSQISEGINAHDKGINAASLNEIFGTPSQSDNAPSDHSTTLSEPHDHPGAAIIASSLEQQTDSASRQTENSHLSVNHDTANHAASLAPSGEPQSQIHVHEANSTPEQQSLAPPEQQSDILRQITSPSRIALEHSGVNEAHFSDSLASIAPDAFIFKPGLGDEIPHHAISAAEHASVMHQLAQLHSEIHAHLQTATAESLPLAAGVPFIGHEPASHQSPHDFHLG